MKQALIVIDMQNLLIDLHPLHYPEIREKVSALMKAAHAAHLPIVLVRHTETVEGGLVEGTPGWAFDPLLERLPHDRIMNKTELSAFFRTNLEAYLRELGITHVLVAGMQTEYCIDSTIKGGYERGFHMQVASDCVTTLPGSVLTPEQLNEHYRRAVYPNFAECKPAEEWVRLLEK